MMSLDDRIGNAGKLEKTAGATVFVGKLWPGIVLGRDCFVKYYSKLSINDLSLLYVFEVEVNPKMTGTR